MNIYHPLENAKLTSRFGTRIHPITGVEKFHNGIDLAIAEGTPIKSPQKGKVINKYYNSTGGNQLIIQHDNGFTTGYAHLSDTLVNVGDTVKNGQVIAKVGNTGASTGPHLHFTLKKDGNYLDPEIHLKERKGVAPTSTIVIIILVTIIAFIVAVMTNFLNIRKLYEFQR